MLWTNAYVFKIVKPSDPLSWTDKLMQAHSQSLTRCNNNFIDNEYLAPPRSENLQLNSYNELL